MDLYIEDTEDNRKKFRKACADYGMGDYEFIETIQFVPDWIDFPLHNGSRLDIQTALKGAEQSFDECLQMAPTFTIHDVQVPFLHIHHLLANKKSCRKAKRSNGCIGTGKNQKVKKRKGFLISLNELQNDFGVCTRTAIFPQASSEKNPTGQ